MRAKNFCGLAGAACLAFSGSAAVNAQVTVSGGNVSVNTGEAVVNVDAGRVSVRTAPAGQTAVATGNGSTAVNVAGDRTTVKSQGQTAVAVGSGRKAINIGSGNSVSNERGTIDGKPVAASAEKPGQLHKGMRGKAQAKDDPFWGDDDFWGDEGEPGSGKAGKDERGKRGNR